MLLRERRSGGAGGQRGGDQEADGGSQTSRTISFSSVSTSCAEPKRSAALGWRQRSSSLSNASDTPGASRLGSGSAAPCGCDLGCTPVSRWYSTAAIE